MPDHFPGDASEPSPSYDQSTENRWQLSGTSRWYPVPTFPSIEPGPHEIQEIAGTLFSMFYSSARSKTEEEAGNNFIALMHARLHHRLSHLRIPFIQDAMKATGMTYKEADAVFEAVRSATMDMKMLATCALFGAEETNANRQARIDRVESEYVHAMVELNRVVDLINAKADERTAEKPASVVEMLDGLQERIQGVPGQITRAVMEQLERIVKAETEVDGSTPRMTVEDANKKAMELAKAMKREFFKLSIRKQAALIGCAFQTWKDTPFFDVAV